ncbi:MAG TPA: hypothetical protein DCZ13_07955 [Porticoccaceae bacterium]|nr:hypothetical protein [Porticoccaceae bacterium]
MEIHQVKGRHVNSYVIEDQHGLLVVDASWRGEKYVLGYIREVLGRHPTDVELVVCTHGDPDHSGGIVKLAAICHAKLGVPYATQSPLLKFINDPAGILFRLGTAAIEGMRPRAWTMYANPRRDAQAKLLPSYLPESDQPREDFDGKPDYRLKNKTSLPGFEDWEVIHTPGHSWDSCCYFHRPTHTLISGDTLLGSTSKGRLVAPAIFSNPTQLKRSMARLKSREPKAVYPGHGAVFEGDGLLDHL